MSTGDSGFARALAALSESDVDFVIVGVGGINFYARTPSEAFSTLHLDALRAPSATNLARALSALAGLGYTFEAGGEPFVDVDDAVILTRVIENGASISAVHPAEGEIDLLTSISGFDFAALSTDTAEFEVAGSWVHVAQLDKLLRSKEASGRPKDLEFLRAFRASRSEDWFSGRCDWTNTTQHNEAPRPNQAEALAFEWSTRPDSNWRPVAAFSRSTRCSLVARSSPSRWQIGRRIAQVMDSSTKSSTPGPVEVGNDRQPTARSGNWD